MKEYTEARIYMQAIEDVCITIESIINSIKSTMEERADEDYWEDWRAEQKTKIECLEKIIDRISFPVKFK